LTTANGTVWSCSPAMSKSGPRSGFLMRQFAIDKGTPRYYSLVKQDNMNGASTIMQKIEITAVLQ